MVYVPGLRRALLVFALVARAAVADEAADLARRSTTIYLTNELSPLPSVGARVELGGGVRLARGGWLLEGRNGAAVAGSALGGGWLGGGRVGLAGGHAFVLGEHVALAPMLAFDELFYAQNDSKTLAIERFLVEIPVTIAPFPHVIVEPFLGRAQLTFGTWDAAVAGGARIGIVFY
jgi:hypothetical protein